MVKRDRLATFVVLSVGYTLAAILWLKQVVTMDNRMWIVFAIVLIASVLMLFTFGM